MIFKSPIFTQVSGSIAGMTFAHNTAGLYIRARSIPTNPNSAQQQATRATFGSLSTSWRDVLTQGQRDVWTEYAANSPVTGKLGDTLFLSGQQMYLRCNTVRSQGILAAVDDGPLVFGLADMTPPDLEFADGGSDMNVNFTEADNWANEDDGALMIQVGRQKSATINFFRGPWRFAGEILGAAVAPTTPLQLVNPFETNYTLGNRVYWRATAVRADGRVSNVSEGSAIVT